MMKRLIITALFLVPALSSAASVSVVLDTMHQSVNTLEATIRYPQGVSIDRVEDGDSVLLIWVKPPVIDNIAHTVTFTGLTPGGFEGVRPVLSLTGDFKESDVSAFSASGVTALLNDGKGTPAKVKLTLVPGVVVADTESPEPFTPVFAESVDIFGGERFISFLTQDKQTGVERYEYAATRFLNPGSTDWQSAESPYIVPQSDYSKTLYIRAVDRAGNSRISSIAGPTRTRSRLEWGILFVLIACVLYFRRRFF
ncbi:hypothetical protein KW800_00040 [Candidatus Parcubacteria bacterium]|nr:hypothetical protein [Candidatus Parcubacteria bacterium]